jgi:hypothetical protein
MLRLRLLLLPFATFPSLALAQFTDSPASPEFSRQFQRCEAMGDADACRRALSWGRMDPQTRDVLLRNLREAERSEFNRARNQQFEALLASCRAGTLPDCDRALQMGLSTSGRERVEAARRQAQAATQPTDSERYWRERQEASRREGAERQAQARVEQERRDAEARGVGMRRPANAGFYRHAEFAALCRAPDYSVAITWVATDSKCWECYRYELTCTDGATHLLKSGYSPFSTVLDGILYQHNMVIVWLALLAVASVAGIAWAADRSGPHLKYGLGFLAYVILIFPQFAYAASLPGRGWYPIGELLFSLTLLVVLPLFVWLFAKPFLKGFDYLFVPHPAEQVVERALASGEPVDAAALSAALAPDLSQITAPPPVFRSENQAARARALQDKLKADQAVAEEAIRREAARAQQEGWSA